MAAYTNAVSDRLFVFKYPESTSICVCSRGGQPKWYIPKYNQEILLDQLGFSGALFSQSYEVDCNGSFSLCPEGVDQEEAQNYFRVTSSVDSALRRSSLGNQIEVLFPDVPVDARLKKLLVQPKQQTDIQLLHEYKKGLSQSNSVYLTLNQNYLIIRAYSAQKLILANRFAVESSDDIFYFVMFALEQLQLDLPKVHFEFIGEDQAYEELKQLFQNYLPMLLHIPNVQLDEDSLPPEQLEEFRNDWFASIAIQCAL